MTTRRIVTPHVRAKSTPIARLPSIPAPRDIVEIIDPSSRDPRAELVRHDTLTNATDMARSALWGGDAPKLDAVLLESLVGNAMALATSVRAVVSIVTLPRPSPMKLRDTLRDAHCRGVDLVLGLEMVREATRVLR